jgi:hypothetical protein
VDYIFSPEAGEELTSAFNYYEDIVAGLGYDLLDEVDSVLKRLLEFPASAPFLTERIRKAVLHNFPFSILYSFSDDTLRITAFMHQKRKPNYWKDRI